MGNNTDIFLNVSETAAQSGGLHVTWIWFAVFAAVVCIFLFVRRKMRSGGSAAPPAAGRNAGMVRRQGVGGAASSDTPQIQPENVRAMFRLISDVAQGLRESGK